MQNKQILIVEDDKAINDMVCEVLSDAGYECSQAFHGGEAKEILENKKFDLVLSDFRMPILNGVQVLNWVRSSSDHTPFVFMTANKNLLEDELKAINDCCSSLIRKPFELDELFAAVEAGLNRVHGEHCKLIKLAENNL